MALTERGIGELVTQQLDNGQIKSYWRTEFWDRFIDFTLWTEDITQHTPGERAPLIPNWDPFRANIDTYNQLAPNSVTTPRFGLKPNCTVTLEMLPGQNVKTINLSIMNYHSDIDILHYRSMLIRMGYRSGIFREFACTIFNCYQEKPNPEGATVFQALINDPDGGATSSLWDDQFVTLKMIPDGNVNIFEQWKAFEPRYGILFEWEYEGVPKVWKELKPRAMDKELQLIWKNLPSRPGDTELFYTEGKSAHRPYYGMTGVMSASNLRQQLQEYFDKVSAHLGYPMIHIDVVVKTTTNPDYASQLQSFNKFVSENNGKLVYDSSQQIDPSTAYGNWTMKQGHRNYKVYRVKGQDWVTPENKLYTYKIVASALSGASKDENIRLLNSPKVIYLDKIISAIDNGGDVQITAPWDPRLEPMYSSDQNNGGYFVMDKRFFRGALAASQVALQRPLSSLFRAISIRVVFSTFNQNQMIIKAVPCYDIGKPMSNRDTLEQPVETEQSAVLTNDDKPETTVVGDDPTLPAADLAGLDYEVVSGDILGLIYQRVNWPSTSAILQAYPDTHIEWKGGWYSYKITYPDGTVTEHQVYRNEGDTTNWLIERFNPNSDCLKPGDIIRFRSNNGH